MNDKPSYFKKFLDEQSIESIEVPYKGLKTTVSTLPKLYRILKEWKPDVIHTHLVDANLLGMIAGKAIGIPKRIFTRHNSTYHKEYHPKSTIIDKFVAYLSTDIIAISKNVEDLLVIDENNPQSKVHLVYHGFDLNAINKNLDVANLKKKINIASKYPIIGIVSRYMHWKGIQYIIPAFKKVLENYPNALLLICGNKNGDLSAEVSSMLSELPEHSYQEVGFVDNVYDYYKLMDIFIHVPINEKIEAFGQIYIETLLAERPSIITLSGIAREIMRSGYNCLTVDFKNSKEIHEAIIEYVENPDLYKNIQKNCLASLDERFSIETKVKALENIYKGEPA